MDRMIGRRLVTLEAKGGAEFEELANQLLNRGYRMGAASISVEDMRWAAIFELPGAAHTVGNRLADVQMRLQQMLSLLRDWDRQDIPPEDCIAELDRRIKSAFQSLCKPKRVDDENRDSHPDKKVKE